jgi:glucose/arabinose dehydrogenase
MRLLTIGPLAALLALAPFTPATAAETNSTSNIGLMLMAEGFGAPIGLVPIPDGSGRLLVAEQAGVIQLLDRDGKKAEQPFLDLRGKIVALGKGMEERGLLGLALHPQFKSNHKFYVVYSAPLRTNAPPKWDHAERLSEFKTTGADFATADPASERIVLEIDEPDWNHNSGRLAFGPDGFLYWTVGDGGAFNDVGDVARGRGHPPEGNGQKLDTLLGKVLRLDVDHGTPYGIPKDNPYADGKKGLPEILAYGLRNPWGISFDRGGKHDLIVVDVGQDRWEEINVIINGGNYGWRLREGFDGFDPKKPNSAPTNAVTVGADGKPFVDPVFAYKTLRGRGTDPEAYGVTITGGYVYRGKAFPSLVGKYIFADWSRSMAIADGTLLVATIPPAGSGNARWSVQPLALKEFPNGRIKSFIWALGEDDDGELYVLANGINSVVNTRGKVFKLVPQEKWP